MKKAINVFTTYTTSSEIDCEGASGILFKNEGNTTLLINNQLSLEPGDAIAFNQLCCDTVDDSQYSVQFLPTAEVAAPIAQPAEAPFTSTDAYNKLVVVKIGIKKSNC